MKYVLLADILNVNEVYALQAAVDRSLFMLLLLVGAAILIARRFPLPRFDIPPIVLVMAGSLIVRLPLLVRPLWYDETFTARLAAASWSNIWPAILSDVHPPLWYLIEWINVRFLGSSEIALRLPSLLFGVGCIWAVWRLASVHLSPRGAMLAALFVAVLPMFAYYSAEARAYSMLAFCVLTAMYCIHARQGWRFALAAGVLPLIHVHGYIYLAMLGICALASWQRPTLPILVSGLGAVVWLPSMIQQAKDVSDGFWLQPLTFEGFFSPVFQMTVGYKLPAGLQMIALLLVAGLTLLSWRGLIQRGPLGAVFIGVPLLTALVSVLLSNIYLARALLPVVMLLPIAWAGLLAERPRAAAAALSVFIASAAAAAYLPPAFNVQTILTENCQDAPAVYTTAIPAAMFSAYYLPQPLTLWAGANDTNQTLSAEAKAALFNLGEPVPGSCLVVFDTPHTAPAERAEIATILAQQPAAGGAVVTLNDTWEIQVYRLRGF